MKHTRFLVALILLGTVLLPLCGAAPVPVSGHRRVAILVSVDQYKDGAKDERLRWLKGCHQDLEAMRKTLKEDYKFDVLELRNESATKDNILKILREVASKVAQPNDRIVFYFSGLGSMDSYGKPTLCPYDARSEDSKNDIKANDLYEWVHEKIKKNVDNVVFILDCAFTEPPAGKGAPVRPKFFNRNPQQVPDFAVIQDALNGIVKRKGVLLSACQPEEGAWETLRRKDRTTGKEMWAGIFSRQLIRRLETLKGAQLSYRELVEWVRSDVRAYVADALYSNPDYRQTPDLFGQEKYKDRALFSPQSPPPVRQKPGYVNVALRDEGDGSSVRLRIVFYGQDATWGQQLKKRIEKDMLHVQLVEREESADQSLHIYQTGTDLRAYLVDANRVPIGQPFTKAPNDFNGLLQEINARLNDLMSYRWAESLKSKDPASFDVETLAIAANERGSSRDIVRQSETSVPIHLKVNRNGYFTLLLVNPRGTVITVYPTKADQDNSVKANQRIDDLDLHPNRLATGRWKLIAVATMEKAPCDEVLEHVYQSSSSPQKLAYADVQSGKGDASLSADSDARIEPLRPNFIKPTGKGAAGTAANVKYAIRVAHFSVVE